MAHPRLHSHPPATTYNSSHSLPTPLELPPAPQDYTPSSFDLSPRFHFPSTIQKHSVQFHSSWGQQRQAYHCIAECGLGTWRVRSQLEQAGLRVYGWSSLVPLIAYCRRCTIPCEIAGCKELDDCRGRIKKGCLLCEGRG